MKKPLSLTLALFVLLSLTACRKDVEPPSNTDQQKQREPSPYAYTETTDRYYLSRTAVSAGFIYGDDYYYNWNCRIVALPLSELKHNTATEGSLGFVEESTPLCIDPMCEHNSIACPTVMGDHSAQFLIDTKESNGEQAVIYYFRAGYEVLETDGTISVPGQEIVRFDVAEGTAKKVAFSDDPISQLMSYGDYLYYTTTTAKDKYQFHAVKKTGGKATTLAPGDSYLNLVGANKDGVYVNDDKGNVYAIDLAGENYELIFTTPEVYVLFPAGPAELNMFVEGEYLYYFSDFTTEQYPAWANSERMYDYIRHNIRRIRLDDPTGEGELVAENVFESDVYGVYNNVLYYAPFDVNTQIEGNNCQPMYQSKGTILGVDLETLETFTVVSDSGLNFEPTQCYVNDRCIIGDMLPYREVKGMPGYGWPPMLYDFETGAMFGAYGTQN